ncbi:MAG: bifunctional phosphoribosylaminoimidazolecarboxamide formyltransferase/IMP cyclohydrolase, partial [Janthinobacterium lividum]
VTEVADLTGFPEMMDGRLKTLHPLVHGGLLAIRENPTHEAAMLAHAIRPIDLLVVNLYPFEATVARGGTPEECVENIDIGGPAMIRGAAKNHDDVAVVVDVADYAVVRAEMEAHAGATTLKVRRGLAQKAYARTAAYDATIANHLASTALEETPTFRALGGTLQEALRYGENPHQKAGFYRTLDARPGVGSAKLIQGKALSYNNIGDADAAFEMVGEFDPAGPAAVAIIKHANPCGVGTGQTAAEAYARALRCDPVSAFGGVVAVNRRVDAALATELAKIFTEAIIAPDADDEARAILGAKKNLRLLLTGGLPDRRQPGLLWRSVSGGFLVQERDAATVDDFDLKIVTQRAPSATEMEDLRFASRVVKHVKSNAIVFAKCGATVGIGAGQMSRVDSVRTAVWKAKEAAKAAGESQSLARGAAMASDAFFPFADGLEAAVAAGITAVIQPGGSLRDAEVVAAADKAGIAMVLTGIRHFKH